MKKYFTIFLFLKVNIAYSTGCPEICKCDNSTLYTDCFNRNITEFPTNFPAETKTIRLDKNALRSIDVLSLNRISKSIVKLFIR